MDVKKFAAIAAALAMAGTVSLATAPPDLFDNLLPVSAATYLKLESSGDSVKQLQQNLIALNYMQSGSNTGTFDETTDGAVKNFQSDYNLKVDGIVGPDTLGLIEGLVNGTAKVVKVSASNVNVRASAGTSGQKITTVDKDQKLKYDAYETVGGVNWYRVSVGETQGYICGTYVSVVELTPLNSAATAANTANTAADPNSGTLRVTGTILHVRSSTSTSSKKLTTLKNGQTFTYSNVKKVNGINWYYIKVDAKTSGWVMGTFISVVDPSQTSGTLTVTGEVLNVRSDTSTSSQKITTLKAGQVYNYSNVKNVDGINWYYIQVNSSTNGWVLGSFISLAPTGTTAAESGSLKVTGTVLNVRSSTSTSSKKLTTLKNGQTFTYSNTKTVKGIKWYYIRVNANISGWVMGTYVYPTPNTVASTTTTTTEAPTTTTVPAAESGTLKVKGTLVNVRSGAGIDNDKITEVKQNENYTYTDAKDGWYYIQVNANQSGWIMGEYVEATPNTTAGTNASGVSNENTAGAESGTLRVTGDVVNVRSGAGTENPKITAVKQGDNYTYTDKKDGWYYIQLSASQSGWIKGDFVEATANTTTTTTTSSPSTATTTAPPESGTLKIASNLVNVRSGIGTDNAKITEVKLGETYTYTDKKNGWYYIQVSSSQSGWIMGDYVEATANTTTTTTTTTAASGETTQTTATESAQSSQTTQATETTQTTQTTVVKSGTLTVTAAVVNVRSGANTGAKVVTTVKKGQTMTYTDVEGDWYYVQYSASQSGWMMGSYAAISPDTGATKTTSQYTAVGTLKVTGAKLNIRSTPDSESSVIAEAKKGETFQYIAQMDNWYCVLLSSSQRGWVIGTYVEASPYPTTRTTTATLSSSVDAAPSSASLVIATGTASSNSGTLEVTAEKSLIVRTGPGTSYEKITEIVPNAKYEYTDVQDNWYCIPLTSTQNGWVSGDYVKATPNQVAVTTTTTESATTTTTTAVSTTTTTTTTAATESTTGTGTDESSTTSVGESTTTAADETTTQEPTTTTTAATVGRKVVVGTVKVSGTLNVRSGAGSKYAKLGTLKNGTTVIIVSKGSKWHKIEYGTGYAYVSAEYIKDIKTTYENMILKYNTDYNYVDKGKTIDLGLSVGGASVSYTSSDSVRCPISNKGVVSGKTPGLYTITAKSGLAITTTNVVVMREPYTDVQTMKISAEGTKFIADWEGGGTVLPTGETVFYPYQDVSGYWTIGYGHAKTTTASKSWSEERAISEFNKDIEAMIGASYVLTDEKPYLTAEGATALLNADLNDGSYVKAVTDWAVRNGVKLTQTQFDALVSFCYNLGPSLWQNDTTKFYLKSAIIAHRSGSDANADQVIEGFCRYMKSSGKNYKGLWYRRRNEAELFLEGDYALDRENKFTLPSGVTWA